MKLTPAQKEVVRKMREGKTVFRAHVNWFYSDGACCSRLNNSTMQSLCRLGIIDTPTFNNSREDYTLTDLGKTIDL